MTKRIGIDVRLGGTGGGIARYIDGLLGSLKHAAPPGIEFVLYGTKPDMRYDIGDYRRLPGGFASYYAKELPNAVRRDDIDALLSPSAFTTFVRACRTVAIVYDVYALYYPRLIGWKAMLSKIGAGYKVRAYAHLFALRGADSVVAISNSTARDLAKFAPDLEARTEVLHADASPIFTTADKLRERFILYVGGFNSHKNVSNIVRAHRIIADRNTDPPRLVLAGYDGWPGIDLDTIVAHEGIPRLTRIWRRPTDEEIIDLYQRCAVFTYTSLYEGFGLPVLEAIRCGAPVVVHDESSLPELAPFEESRVDARDPLALANKLEAVLNTGGGILSQRLMEYAAAAFSFDATARRMLALLLPSDYCAEA